MCKSKWVCLGLIVGTVLLAGTVSAGQVTIAWEPSASAVNDPGVTYAAFVRPADGHYDYDQPVWTGSATTCTLTYDEAVYVIVRTVDTTGRQSPSSNEVYVAAPPPASPANVRQVSASTAQ